MDDYYDSYEVVLSFDDYDFDPMIDAFFDAYIEPFFDEFDPVPLVPEREHDDAHIVAYFAWRCRQQRFAIGSPRSHS